MKTLRALRALLRLEWRQLSRHPKRSLLILALVAVPVAAMVGGTALIGLTQPKPRDYARQVLGRAELRVEGFDTWDRLETALATLPADAPYTVGATGFEEVGVAGTVLGAKLLVLDPSALAPPEPSPDLWSDGPNTPSEALATGIALLVEGRAPENAGEVALSPPLLDGLGLALGDRVFLEYGGSREVTGVVVEPHRLDRPLIVRSPAAAEMPGRRFLLAAVAPTQTPALAEALRAHDLRVLTRDEAAVGDEALTAFVFALGIIGLFEAALVISAAFGVALRRRQVEIGLLGSVGATARAMTRSLLIATAGLASIGGVIGTLLGYVGVFILWPWLEGLTGRMTPPVTFAPGIALGAILLGVIAAVAAAALPARSAARLPVRQALAGRRPSSRRSRPWLVVGLVLIVGGVGLLLLSTLENKILRGLGVTLGPILSILGFGACSPWLLEWTTRRAGALPLAWRLAVRDAGRFRERNAAVVTAVLASMAMSVTMAALVASLQGTMGSFPVIFRDDQLRFSGPGAADAAAEARDALGAVAAAPLRAVYRHGEPVRGRIDGRDIDRRSGWIAVGGPELLDVLGATAGLEDFKAGRLVALDIDAEAGALDFSTWVSGDAVATPEVARVSTDRTLRGPVFVLSSAALERYGFDDGTPPRGSLMPWLVRLPEPVSEAQLERARTLAGQYVQTRVGAAAMMGDTMRQFYLAVFAICALTGLVVVLTAVSLSAAESAADERVLQTVGASPQLLRGHQAARAGFLALIGCLLALPAGLLAAAAFFGVVNFPLTWVMPWRDLVTIGFALPALIYVGTWCFAGIRRRRPSTSVTAPPTALPS